MLSAARSMALAGTSRPASTFIGSRAGVNGISLPSIASMRLTPEMCIRDSGGIAQYPETQLHGYARLG